MKVSAREKFRKPDWPLSDSAKPAPGEEERSSKDPAGDGAATDRDRPPAEG